MMSSRQGSVNIKEAEGGPRGHEIIEKVNREESEGEPGHQAKGLVGLRHSTETPFRRCWPAQVQDGGHGAGRVKANF